eukprot:UN19800
MVSIEEAKCDSYCLTLCFCNESLEKFVVLWLVHIVSNFQICAQAPKTKIERCLQILIQS